MALPDKIVSCCNSRLLCLARPSLQRRLTAFCVLREKMEPEATESVVALDRGWQLSVPETAVAQLCVHLSFSSHTILTVRINAVRPRAVSHALGPWALSPPSEGFLNFMKQGSSCYSSEDCKQHRVRQTRPRCCVKIRHHTPHSPPWGAHKAMNQGSSGTSAGFGKFLPNLRCEHTFPFSLPVT